MAVRRSRPRRTTLRVRVARSAEQGVEAVHRERFAVCGVGAFAGGLALRRRRGLGLGHRRGALRVARGRIVLVEQHRGQAPAHVPFQIVGQHAEQDVRAHPRRGPMEHRTQLEIDGLQRAEGVLHAAETFVGAHRGGGIGLRGRQVGADHIDAVERGLGGDAGGFLAKLNASSVMVIWKCLAIWRRPSTAPTAWPIAAAPRSGLRARCTRAWMRARSFSVAASSSRALAGALLGQQRVLADHQAFARIVGAGDLGHVAVIEQRGLQRPALGRQLP